MENQRITEQQCTRKNICSWKKVLKNLEITQVFGHLRDYVKNATNICSLKYFFDEILYTEGSVTQKLMRLQRSFIMIYDALQGIQNICMSSIWTIQINPRSRRQSLLFLIFCQFTLYTELRTSFHTFFL